MLRIECPPRLAQASHALPPKLIAIGLGIAMAACSADVTRFDSPMFGLTESGNRVSSAPIPRESVYANSAAPLSDSTPYSSGYYAPTRDSGMRSTPRDYAAYAPSSGSRSDAYQGASSQPGAYNPASYQSYQQQPARPSYEQAGTYTPPRPAAERPAYQAQERHEPQQRVAALHSSTTDTARQFPSRQTESDTAAAGEEPRRPQPTPSAAAGNSREIEVQPGDTLYSLAQRHRVSISELMSLNGLRSPSVRPGQKIVLPPAPTAIAAAVRQGPARKSEPTRVAALGDPAPAALPQPEKPAPAIARDLPAEARESSVKEAPATVAPQPAETAEATAATYTIKNGESLYGIAVRHRVTLAELLRINNITDVHKVRAGTVLKLPPSSQQPSTAVAAAPQAKSAENPAAESTQAVPTKPVTPVIINGPTRVAALDTSGTASDAPPALTAPSSEPSPTPGEPAPSAEGKAKGEPSSPEESKAADAKAKFRWPVRGKIIAGFGRQPDGSHSDGIKLAVPLGTEVHAAESGVVAYAGNELKGYGNLVLLRHDNGWITAYAHNDELSVKRGDRVRRGQVIAKAGNTGNADTPQLHFELRQGSSPVDPIPHLEKL